MSQLHSRGSVVVTGAAGYIGRHVVSAVADLGFDVLAVVRPGRECVLDPRATVVEADVLAPGFDASVLRTSEAVAFIHLAWQDGFAHNAASHMLTVSAHYALLAAVAESGVPRIAALGTMHEVGYWEGGIEADTPANPRTLYGIAKDCLRRACMLVLAQKVEFAWLRCYYIYGDDRSNNSIFTRLLESVDEGKSSFPFTTGTNKYDFIHVDELARQIAVASTTSGVTGIINCSSGEPVSLAEKVEEYIRDEGLPIELDYGAFPDRPYDSPEVWGVADRIADLMAAARDIERIEENPR